MVQTTAAPHDVSEQPWNTVTIPHTLWESMVKAAENIGQQHKPLRAEIEAMRRKLYQAMKRVEMVENEQAQLRATPNAGVQPNNTARPQSDPDHYGENNNNKQDGTFAKHMPDPETGTQEEPNSRKESEPKMGSTKSVGNSPLDANRNKWKN